MSNITQIVKAAEAKVKKLGKLLDQAIAESDHAYEVFEGDKPSCDQARKIKSQPFSFTVHFVRSKVLRKVRSPGAVCKSLRRFGSRKEALQHGKRFAKKHRHQSFSVVHVNKRANAWINWRTGKTNPVLNG